MTKSYKNILKLLSFLGLFITICGVVNADILCPKTITCKLVDGGGGAHTCNWDKTDSYFLDQSTYYTFATGIYEFKYVKKSGAYGVNDLNCFYILRHTDLLTFLISKNSNIVPNWNKIYGEGYDCGSFENRLTADKCPMKIN